MAEPDSATMAARKAKDKLAARLLTNSHVSLIDLGWDPVPATGQPEQRQLVVRVHLKSPGARRLVEIPAEVDGIPVRTIIAEYQLE